ncbi:hypothetical protein N9J96_09315 [Paracoccaceae bacterium]|nr:hypothetical protein [Paracoccaceae bacterium]
MKSSRWRRYDNRSGLWIKHPKPIYLYWFKFLQHAVDEGRDIDWSAYKGWGGKEAIMMDARFDDWWRKNWKNLFGYKLNETEPKFSLSTSKPQNDGIKYSLLVYELHKEKPDIDYWELAKLVAKVEYPRRRYKGTKDANYKPDAWSFNIARLPISKKLEKNDKIDFDKRVLTLRSRVGRYLIVANKHLDNVCQGRFP